MKHLSKRAASTFSNCIAGVESVGNHRRIGEADAGYMALHVECVGTWGIAKVYSLAHYSKQNGDLMADPEMTFLVGTTGLIFPLTYRNDFVGMDQVAAEPNTAGDGCRFNARLQAELCKFANEWMRNLKEQQPSLGKATCNNSEPVTNAEGGE